VRTVHGWRVTLGLASARERGRHRGHLKVRDGRGGRLTTAAVGILTAVGVLVALTALALGPPHTAVPRSAVAAPTGMSTGAHPAIAGSDDPSLRAVEVSPQASELVGDGSAGRPDGPPRAATEPAGSQNIAVDFGESSTPPSLAGSSQAGGSGLVLTAALEPGVAEPCLMSGPTRTAYLGRLTRIFSRPQVRPG
jgi:hypothetical protein